MTLRRNFQPGGAALLRGLDFGRRGNAALPLVTVILFFATGLIAQTTNSLTDAEIKGRELARQLVGLYEQRPATNCVQTCVLKIRPAKNQTVEFSLRCTVSLTPTNWQQVCETIRTNSDGFTDGNYLRIIHADGRENEYLWNNHSYNGARINPARSDPTEARWSGTARVHPFSDSDFWAVDLGLEFFHWPDQKSHAQIRHFTPVLEKGGI